MFPVFSREAVASESEFLRRELGCEWTPVSQDDLVDLVRRGNPVVIGVSEPEPYREVLSVARPGSVVLLMTSDEAYTSERVALASSPAVRSVYRQYGLAEASALDSAIEVGNVAAGAPRAGVRPSIAASVLAEGRRTRARMRTWKRVPVPVTAVPLGYTTGFAMAVTRLFDLPPDASLIDAALAAALVTQGGRQEGLFFRGAAGSIQRRVMLARSARHPNARIEVIDTDWTDPQREVDVYVTGLLSTTHALCPPGAINTETFRFYESLICGAIPVEPRTALTHLGRPVCRGPRPLEQTKLALTSIVERMRADVEVRS